MVVMREQRDPVLGVHGAWPPPCRAVRVRSPACSSSVDREILLVCSERSSVDRAGAELPTGTKPEDSRRACGLPCSSLRPGSAPLREQGAIRDILFGDPWPVRRPATQKAGGLGPKSWQRQRQRQRVDLPSSSGGHPIPAPWRPS